MTNSSPAMGAMESWLQRHQHKFHEEFHAFEGPKEDCTEGYCGEINPLVSGIREQDAIAASLLAALKAVTIAAAEMFGDYELPESGDWWDAIKQADAAIALAEARE